MNDHYLAPTLAEAKRIESQATADQNRLVRMHLEGAKPPDRFDGARMFIRKLFAPKPLGQVQKQGSASPS